MTYCTLSGQGSDPFAGPYPGRGQIETSGSSTTVTGVNAADDVFTDIGVGDVLFTRTGAGVTSLRVVTAKASVDSITVNTAIDLTGGVNWTYKKLACGTSATDGWIDATGDTVQLTVQYDAGDLDTLDVSWFCREAAPGSGAIRVYPGPASDCGDGTLSGTVCTFATTGQGLAVKIPNNVFSACRVGLKYGSTDGATREEVTATITVPD
jgi:hypothetical protein